MIKPTAMSTPVPILGFPTARTRALWEKTIDSRSIMDSVQDKLEKENCKEAINYYHGIKKAGTIETAMTGPS